MITLDLKPPQRREGDVLLRTAPHLLRQRSFIVSHDVLRYLPFFRATEVYYLKIETLDKTSPGHPIASHRTASHRTNHTKKLSTLLSESLPTYVPIYQLDSRHSRPGR